MISLLFLSTYYVNNNIINGLIFGIIIGVLLETISFSFYTVLPVSIRLASYWFLFSFIEGLMGSLLLTIIKTYILLK